MKSSLPTTSTIAVEPQFSVDATSVWPRASEGRGAGRPIDARKGFWLVVGSGLARATVGSSNVTITIPRRLFPPLRSGGGLEWGQRAAAALINHPHPVLPPLSQGKGRMLGRPTVIPQNQIE